MGWQRPLADFDDTIALQYLHIAAGTISAPL